LKEEKKVNISLGQNIEDFYLWTFLEAIYKGLQRGKRVSTVSRSVPMIPFIILLARQGDQ